MVPFSRSGTSKFIFILIQNFFMTKSTLLEFLKFFYRLFCCFRFKTRHSINVIHSDPAPSGLFVGHGFFVGSGLFLCNTDTVQYRNISVGLGLPVLYLWTMIFVKYRYLHLVGYRLGLYTILDPDTTQCTVFDHIYFEKARCNTKLYQYCLTYRYRYSLYLTRIWLLERTSVSCGKNKR